MSSSKSPVVYLLTGDIGGTNSRMSLYKVDDEAGINDNKKNTISGDGGTDSRMSLYKVDDQAGINNNKKNTISGGMTKPTISKTFRNSKQFVPESVLEEDNAFIDFVLKPFLVHCWEEKHVHKVALPPLESAKTKIFCCIASAGVVSDNQVRLTNLGNLLISGKHIEKDRSNHYMKSLVRCLVINDFVAQGYGCLTLQPHEVQHLYGPVDFEAAKGPKACVGAGTGLGECFLTQSEHPMGPTHLSNPYSCYPSEGGHVDYAPRNALEVEMVQYLSTKFGTKNRISVERVASGKGLANVYEFLSQKFPNSRNPHVHKAFLEAGDEQGRVVAESASSTDGTVCALCQQAMSIMISAYGCEVGSAAIKWIPLGGLFVSGGLTPKNIQYIHGLQSDFMTSYRDKGRVSPILEGVPLYAVLTDDLGVRGAHQAAKVVYESYMAQHGYFFGFCTRSSSSSMSLMERIESLSTTASVVVATAAGMVTGATLALLTTLCKNHYGKST